MSAVRETASSPSVSRREIQAGLFPQFEKRAHIERRTSGLWFTEEQRPMNNSTVSAPEFSARRRIFVGGLAPDVTSEDLHKRFAPFGHVVSVEVILDKFATKGTAQCRGFAFVELGVSQDFMLDRCISTLNRCKWRGREIIVARARPSYLERLERERIGS